MLGQVVTIQTGMDFYQRQQQRDERGMEGQQNSEPLPAIVTNLRRKRNGLLQATSPDPRVPNKQEPDQMRMRIGSPSGKIPPSSTAA